MISKNASAILGCSIREEQVKMINDLLENHIPGRCKDCGKKDRKFDCSEFEGQPGYGKEVRNDFFSDILKTRINNLMCLLVQY
jgi:hypothetical protein